MARLLAVDLLTLQTDMQADGGARANGAPIDELAKVRTELEIAAFLKPLTRAPKP